MKFDRAQMETWVFARSIWMEGLFFIRIKLWQAGILISIFAPYVEET